MKIGKFILPFVFGLFSFFPGSSQEVHKISSLDSWDYIRRVEVNRANGNKNNSLEYVFKFNNFKEPFEDEARNCFDSLDNRILNIYFQTWNSNLTEHDKSDLRRYCCELMDYNLLSKSIKSFIIEGYADCRGNGELNDTVSFNRAEAVATFLRPFFPKTKIYIASFGKTQSKETTDSLKLQKDRVVRIIINQNPFERGIEFCKGKIFLVDGTGSVNECYHFMDCGWIQRLLQNCAFPDSMPVYSYSGNIKKGDPIGDIRKELSMGLTSHLIALEILVSSRPEYDILTTIVHGEDTFGKSTPEKVIETANKKQSQVNNIGINLSEEYRKKLRTISEKTKGKYYFFWRFN